MNTPSEKEIMAEKSDQTEKPEENLDLSGLSSMSLGPDWVSGKKPRTQLPKESYGDRPRSRGGPNKDRRGFKPRRTGGREGGGRPHPSGRGDFRDRREHEPFKPIVHVDFYPEEEPFRVLSQAIRTSYRTYELFEIARLILEKPDRFVCLVKDPAQKEGEPALLHASVPDGLPFRSEEEAIGHVFRHYMGEFFNLETHEVEAPAGSFQMVHKCGMTGELLGAPNYHRYQALCREHHAARLAHVPYSKFEQRIESTREEADIQAWLEKMKTQTKYILKENPELTFGNAEDARLYLVTQSKDKLVRPAYSARFSGKTLALLNPSDPIRRSVEVLHENQIKFPLETANHLRGRLRRMHFAVYKRGSKGISYVCAVKRRFRMPDEVLADNLQELIDFLEAHPNFPAKELPKTFLGIDPDGKPKPADTGAEPTAEADEASAAAPSEGGKKESPEQDTKAIQQLKMDLRYLVSEGYVTEYSDGRLFVPGIREEEIRHIEKQKEKAAQSGDGESGEPVVDKASSDKEEAEKEDEIPAVEAADPGTSAVAEPEPVKEAASEEPVPEDEVQKVEPVVEADPMEPEKEQPVPEADPVIPIVDLPEQEPAPEAAPVPEEKKEPEEEPVEEEEPDPSAADPEPKSEDTPGKATEEASDEASESKTEPAGDEPDKPKA